MGSMKHLLSFLKAILCLLAIGLSACGPSGNPEVAPATTSPEPGANKEQATTTRAAPTPPVVVEPPDIPALGHPASPLEAARAMDLSAFPVMTEATDARRSSTANLAYRAKTNVKSAYEFQKKGLTAQRWREQSGASVTDEYASGTFTRADFTLSVTVIPASDAGMVDVMVKNHGNVNFGKLPRPDAVKPVYVGLVSAIYETEAPLAATVETAHRLLQTDGWETYGSAGDSTYFKKNAVMLHVTIQSAPAQGGKTMISYSSEQMSGNIPAPAGVEDLRYDDMAKRLTCQTTMEKDAFATSYKEVLAKSGWKPNREELWKIDDKYIMAFRNSEKDLIWMDVMPGPDNKLNIALKYQSAADLVEEERQIEILRAANLKKRAEEKAAAAGKQ